MIADNLHDFLLASVGASASFIGLLFVALTLVLGRIPTGSALAGRDRALASSAYTALITIFFISLIGLVPNANLAWALVAVGWLGALSSLRSARVQHVEAATHAETPAVVGTLTLIYVALAFFGLYTAGSADKHISTNILLTIVVVLYAAALTRAWSLLGVELPRNKDTSQPTKKQA
jgi:hypothetical protein